MELTHEQECEKIVETISALPNETLQKLHLPKPPTNANMTPAEICAQKMAKIEGGQVNGEDPQQFFQKMKASGSVGGTVSLDTNESAKEAVQELNA